MKKTLIFLFIIYITSAAEIFGKTRSEDFDSSISSEFKGFVSDVIRYAMLKDYENLAGAYNFSLLKVKHNDQNAKFIPSGINYLSDNIAVLMSRIYSPEFNKNGDLNKIKTPIKDYRAKAQLAEEEIQNEIKRIKKLKKNVIFDVTANIFNTVAQAFGQLLTGQIHIILQVTFESFYNIYQSGKWDARDAEILTLYHLFQKKHPDSDIAKKEQSKINSLENTRRKYLVRSYIRRSRNLKEQGSFYFADFFISRAEYLSRGYKEKKIKKSDLQIQQEESQARRNIYKSLDFSAPSYESTIKPEEKSEYKNVLQSVLSSDTESMKKSGKQFIERYPKSKAAEQVLLSLEICGMKGNSKENIVEKLDNVKRMLSDSDLRRRVVCHILNPYFSAYEMFKKSLSTRRKETAIYSLTGYRSNEENLKITVSALFNSPETSAQTLGSLLVIEIALRTLLLPFVNPVSAQACVDSGRAALPDLNDLKKKNEIYDYLRKQYYKRKEYEKSLEFLKFSDNYSPKKEKKIRKKWAFYEVETANDLKIADNKIKHLKKAAEIYDDEKFKIKMNKEIAELEKLKSVFFWIDKKNLKKYKDSLNFTDMPIDLSLIDGKKKNGEMDERGIGFKGDNEFVYYDIKDKDYVLRRVYLSDADKEKFNAIVAELWKNTDIEESVNKYSKKRYFPVELHGSFGEGGFNLYPQIQTSDKF